MPEWVTFILIFAAYFAVMKWVLPRLGFHT